MAVAVVGSGRETSRSRRCAGNCQTRRFCGRLAALSDTAAPYADSNSRSTTAQVECSAGWVALALWSL